MMHVPARIPSATRRAALRIVASSLSVPEKLHLEALPGARAGEALDRLRKPREAHAELLDVVDEALRIGAVAKPPAEPAQQEGAGHREGVERGIELADASAASGRAPSR